MTVSVRHAAFLCTYFYFLSSLQGAVGTGRGGIYCTFLRDTWEHGFGIYGVVVVVMALLLDNAGHMSFT